jgi:hypothetical protein
MNAKLNPGDWVLGHTSRETGQRLVYAMRLTRVLDMPKYFQEFPQKRPKIGGAREDRCGDNFYNRENGRWIRIPSTQHNNPKAFRQDQNRKVYLAEGETNFWYFGASNPSSCVTKFPDLFPELVKDRQGFSYLNDKSVIERFVEWIAEQAPPGLRGEPRDLVPEAADRYLTTIDPIEFWVDHDELDSPQVTPELGAAVKYSKSRGNRCS